MSEKGQREFDFMSEQLKKKPFYKMRWFRKGIGACALAILFGAAAGITFSVVQPWGKKQFGEPEDPAQVIVVREETETEETEAPQTETAETEAPHTVIERKDLEISDYKMLYRKMAQVAESVYPSVVTVTCETSNVDWFNEVIENRIQTAGLIIAQSQQEYFILTGSHAAVEAERIIVTFSDGTVADASLQKRDAATGLLVLCVRKSSLPADMDGIAPAELGVSGNMKQGEPVIALGTPVANNSSMSFGMITSMVEMPVVDAQYRVLNTDILGSQQGSGILIDLDGKIMGIIAQSFSSDSGQITLTALAVPDIQELVMDLANGRERPTVGIVGKEIDATIAEEFHMPQGIYVRSVAEDSPAMHAGVYVADIITGIDGKEILTIEDYRQEIQKHSPEEMVKLEIKRTSVDGYVDMEVLVQLGR